MSEHINFEMPDLSDFKKANDYLLCGVGKASNPYYYDGIEIGTPFNLKDVVAKWGKEIIPDELGIYHLFLDDHLVYVGMSTSIRKRLLYHLKDDLMPFDNVLWFCAKLYRENIAIDDVLEIEKNMIKQLRPPLNMRHYSTNNL